MPTNSPDEIGGISKSDANDLTREVSQLLGPIVGDQIRDKVKKGSKLAFKSAEKISEPLRDRIDNPASRYGHRTDQGTTPGKYQSRQQSGPSRNPKILGRKMHEINQQLGTKGKDGVIRYSGANFDITSRGKGNITVTPKGSTEPILQIKQNRVKVNKVTKSQAASIHKAHAKTVSKGVGR